jgi:hypothetical protein
MMVVSQATERAPSGPTAWSFAPCLYLSWHEFNMEVKGKIDDLYASPPARYPD